MLESHATVTGHDSQSDAAAQHRRPVDIIPFAAWHLHELDLRAEQWVVRPVLTEEYGRALEDAGGGFSAFEGDDVIAMAGIVTCWPGRGQVWALITPRIQTRALIIHRAVYRAVQAFTGRRLECVIDPQFESSVEWARRLGFVYESTMVRYGFDGRTMDMYVKKVTR